MAKQARYMLHCKLCGHNRDTATMGKNRPPDEVTKRIKGYKCSKCKSKNVSVIVKHTNRKTIEYAATKNSVDMVFHKSTCGQMRNVSAINEIRSKNREVFINRGYTPCRSCRP